MHLCACCLRLGQYLQNPVRLESIADYNRVDVLPRLPLRAGLEELLELPSRFLLTADATCSKDNSMSEHVSCSVRFSVLFNHYRPSPVSTAMKFVSFAIRS